MADLLWPGDERAGDLFAADLAALTRVETAWLAALSAVPATVLPGTGPGSDRDLADLAELLREGDTEAVALAAEASGQPVVALVALLRERLAGGPGADDGAARLLHRGLTSQDVLDTAVVLEARRTTAAVLALLDDVAGSLAALADRHRHDVMAARTLTQHAVPTTFGLKAAQWLAGVLDARDELRSLAFPVQVGGAAGTLAALVELTGDPDAAWAVVADAAARLGLDAVPSWHTTRTPLTRYADALVRTTDALGHVANDVLLLARPEVGELAEPRAPGRGGSSTMPQKANPVLSLLVRRAALTTPLLAAQLHLAAAEAVDERPDGAWHTEWSTLATLSRRTLVAVSQAAELLAGLEVRTERMARRSEDVAGDLLAERTALRRALGRPDPDGERPGPSGYLGASDRLVQAVLDRVHPPEENP